MQMVSSSLVYQNAQLSHYVHGVKKLYAGLDLKPKVEAEAGKIPYPSQDHNGKGMHIEFK